ncbi:glycosyltransferase family 8 protein [Adlercreutzia sp. ZJ141]|uniref:glycosyltransferase family 8 protein n=1 Tax=Adlercreutzia sp. ZJ141 TaxID=2709406 RepID=UPI0013EB0A7D|nr:glycosyltransferase family 8 protein [Adlercreutzia sp. ZJ141]
MDKQGKLNALYATDEGFVEVLIVSLTSLFENSCRPIRVFVIEDGLSQKSINMLEDLATHYCQEIEFIKIPDYSSMFGRVIDAKRYALSAFSRLFVSSMLPPEITRVLYLDCDTIICEDLGDLWNTDLQGAVMGAVNDCRSYRYSTNLGLSRNDVYFNSGVLIIDLDLYRKEGIEERFAAAIFEFDGLLEFPDNDLICRELAGKIKELHPRYNLISVVRALSVSELLVFRNPDNYYSSDLVEEAKNNPAIVHYTSFFAFNGRPWNKGYDEFDGRFFSCYRAISLVRDVPLRVNWSNWGSRSRILFSAMPRAVSLRLFGFVHSVLKPTVQYFALKRYKKAFRNEF